MNNPKLDECYIKANNLFYGVNVKTVKNFLQCIITFSKRTRRVFVEYPGHKWPNFMVLREVEEDYSIGLI